MTKKEVRQTLAQARPSLKVVSPLTYRIVQGFVGINLLIAILMFFITTTVKGVPNPAAAGFLNYQAWGFVFMLLAGIKFYGLITNSWKIIKAGLLMGLFTKLIWLFSLVVLVFQGYNVFVTMMLWLFLAWVQAWTIVHFIPILDWNQDE